MTGRSGAAARSAAATSLTRTAGVKRPPTGRGAFAALRRIAYGVSSGCAAG
jgi:hypothetical protein